MQEEIAPLRITTQHPAVVQQVGQQRIDVRRRRFTVAFLPCRIFQRIQQARFVKSQLSLRVRIGKERKCGPFQNAAFVGQRHIVRIRDGHTLRSRQQLLNGFVVKLGAARRELHAVGFVHGKAQQRVQQRIGLQRVHLRRAVELRNQRSGVEAAPGGVSADAEVALFRIQRAQHEDREVGRQLAVLVEVDRAAGDERRAIVVIGQCFGQGFEELRVAVDLVQPVEQQHDFAAPQPVAPMVGGGQVGKRFAAVTFGQIFGQAAFGLGAGQFPQPQADAGGDELPSAHSQLVMGRAPRQILRQRRFAAAGRAEHEEARHIAAGSLHGLSEIGQHFVERELFVGDEILLQRFFPAAQFDDARRGERVVFVWAAIRLVALVVGARQFVAFDFAQQRQFPVMRFQPDIFAPDDFQLGALFLLEAAHSFALFRAVTHEFQQALHRLDADGFRLDGIVGVAAFGVLQRQLRFGFVRRGHDDDGAARQIRGFQLARN